MKSVARIQVNSERRILVLHGRLLRYLIHREHLPRSDLCSEVTTSEEKTNVSNN